MTPAAIERVVVGFDGSPAAGAAAAWATAEAERHHARLVVWTILDRHSHQVSGPPDLGAAPFEWRSVYGRPAAELLNACGPRDLLVIGATGGSDGVRLYRGSVVRRCLHLASGPVAVVPAGSADPGHRRVMVGIDGSAASRRALAVAAEEAKLRGADLHAVHAVHWDSHGTELMRPSTKDLVGWGRHLVEAELCRAGISAHSVVVAGHAADVLVRHSSHADLLVVGSRGHHPLAGLLVGSVAEHCALHSRCTTLLVRPE